MSEFELFFKDLIIGFSLLWLVPWSIYVTGWIIKKEREENDKRF